MKPKVLLAEMTREHIRAIAGETTVLLPTAAIEQHGPHLAIVTDTLVCTTICQRAAEIASEQRPVTVAPPIHFGSSHHHFPHPGVLSLTSGTFTTVVQEICASLVRSGFRRIMIVNGHGGNDNEIRVAARLVGLEYPVSIAAAAYWTVAAQALVEDGRVGEVGQLPGHAGGFETSLMMALRPDLVDTANYPKALARPPFVADMTLRASVIHSGESLGSGPGYTDDPSNASAEAGERMLATICRQLAAFIVDFAGK